MSADSSSSEHQQPPPPTTTTTVVNLTPQQAMTVATLRRSSSHVTPTRTLALSEQEHQARGDSASRGGGGVAVAVVSPPHRSRSNDGRRRTTTPRRRGYESPMDPAAFRRSSLRQEGAEEERQPTRVVETVPATAEERRRHHHRPVSEVLPSRKQGPSHRKVRRWRNDHFDELANQVATHHHGGGGGGQKAADALRKAKEKAHLYKDIVDFRDQTSEPLTRFLQDETLKGVRDKFFAGELPASTATSHRRRRHDDTAAAAGKKLTPQQKLFRVDARLRRVVTRACRNSQPAAMVVKTLETFLLATYGDGRGTAPAGHWWTTLLSHAPAVSSAASDDRVVRRKVRFLFDATSPTGGFHRLLLHAVCQYHGLTAVSQMITTTDDKQRQRQHRALVVTAAPGVIAVPTTAAAADTLLEQMIDDAAQVEILEEPWTLADPTPQVKEEGGWTVVKS